jgi:hypothetical protein
LSVKKASLHVPISDQQSNKHDSLQKRIGERNRGEEEKEIKQNEKEKILRMGMSKSRGGDNEKQRW